MATTATATKPKSEVTTQTQPGTSALANGNGTGRELTPLQQFGQQLQDRTGGFQAALPKHIPADQFKRVVATAVNLNPALLNADRRSLLNAAMKAASDGLLPDGREGAFVTFKDNKTGKEMCQWMPMVFGILKKLRQSAEIAAISARCVYKNEVEQGRFSFNIADGEEHLTHDPILFADRGPVVGVYAVAKFKDGTVQHEPLTMEDINKIRGVSRTGRSEYGPWSKWFDEMCRKSAIRRLSKYLPVSAEDLRSSLDRDFHETEADQIRSEVRAEPQSITHAAAALSAPAPTIDAGDGERADAETGVVIEGEVSGQTGQGSEETVAEDEGQFADQAPEVTHNQRADGRRHARLESLARVGHGSDPAPR